MSKLDTAVFEVSTTHRVSYHDYFRNYKRLEAFLQGMDIVRKTESLGGAHQITVDLDDEQFQRFCEFVGTIDTSMV